MKAVKSIIPSGDLKDLVQIQNFVGAPDGAGGNDEDWTTCVEAWARISPFRGGNPRIGMQLQSQTTHEIVVRYDTAIKGQMRILFADPNRPARTFKIVYVHDIEERHEFMMLYCEEGVNTN